MSSNALGTVFRIVLISLALLGFWSVGIAVVYYFVCLIFGFTFSFNIFVLLFFSVIIYRAFYPKNVFI